VKLTKIQHPTFDDFPQQLLIEIIIIEAFLIDFLSFISRTLSFKRYQSFPTSDNFPFSPPHPRAFDQPFSFRRRQGVIDL